MVQDNGSMSLPSSLQLLPLLPDCIFQIQSSPGYRAAWGSAVVLAWGLRERGLSAFPKDGEVLSHEELYTWPRGDLMAHSTSAILPNCLSSWPSQCTDAPTVRAPQWSSRSRFHAVHQLGAQSGNPSHLVLARLQSKNT